MHKHNDELTTAVGMVRGVLIGAAIWALFLLTAGTTNVLTHCETDAECEAIQISFEGVTD
jgi:hypothetical protein